MPSPHEHRLPLAAAFHVIGGAMEQAEQGGGMNEPLCRVIQEKLQRWASLGEAPEYYDLKNRYAFYYFGRFARAPCC